MKKFVTDQYGNLHIEDNSSVIEYDEKKINELCELPPYSSASADYIDSLFHEFMSIYAYDCKTASFPSPFGAFESLEEFSKFKEKKLLVEDFNLYLGSILGTYHEMTVDKALPDIVLGRLVVNYQAIYEYALKDYICALKGVEPTYPFQFVFYGYSEEAETERETLISSMRKQMPQVTYPRTYIAGFMLPTLIEHFLIGFLQDRFVQEKLIELKKLVDNETVTLSYEEKDTVTPLWNNNRYFDGSKVNTMIRCYNIFDKAGIVEEAKDHWQIITATSDKKRKTPLTLNAALSNAYVKEHIKGGYYKVLKVLFSNDGLAIRNNIMHGNDITYDPFAPCFSAIMMQMFWDIISRGIYC